MFPTSAARKYAKSFVTSLPAGGDLAAQAAAFHELAQAVLGRRDLLQALGHPALPLQRKAAVIDALARAMAAPPLCAAFARVIVQNGHLAGLEAIDRAVARAAAEARGVIQAEVRTARPAGEADATRIRQALERAVGRPVEIDFQVDPALLGGFVARAGDLVFDGSMARQIERLRGELLRG